MREMGRRINTHHAHAVPRLESLVEQLPEDPAIAGIPGCVDHREPDHSMVGHVDAAAPPRRMMIDGDHDLRSVAANRCRDVPSKAEAVFNHPVTVSQELHRFDPYDRGTRALLLST